MSTHRGTFDPWESKGKGSAIQSVVKGGNAGIPNLGTPTGLKSGLRGTGIQTPLKGDEFQAGMAGKPLGEGTPPPKALGA